MPAPSPLIVTSVRDITLVTFNDTTMLDTRTIEAIRVQLFDLVNKQNRRKMVLDLSKVQSLSSSALGVLIPLQKRIDERKGDLMLCGLSKEVAKVFKLTGLTKMFRIYKTESAALQEYGITL